MTKNAIAIARDFIAAQSFIVAQHDPVCKKLQQRIWRYAKSLWNAKWRRRLCRVPEQKMGNPFPIR
jgi:hypothetical protein